MRLGFKHFDLSLKRIGRNRSPIASQDHVFQLNDSRSFGDHGFSGSVKHKSVGEPRRKRLTGRFKWNGPQRTFMTCGDVLLLIRSDCLTILRYTRRAMRKEVFVCDNCGTRKRLPSSQRHWCEECKTSSPVELRPVRDKRSAPKPDAPETAGFARR